MSLWALCLFDWENENHYNHTGGHYPSFPFRLPPEHLLWAKELRASSSSSSELGIGACVSWTRMPWAWPAFRRAQRVEKSFGRVCAPPRNCRRSCHSWSRATWSKPHCPHQPRLHTPSPASFLRMPRASPIAAPCRCFRLLQKGEWKSLDLINFNHECLPPRDLSWKGLSCLLFVCLCTPRRSSMSAGIRQAWIRNAILPPSGCVIRVFSWPQPQFPYLLEARNNSTHLVECCISCGYHQCPSDSYVRLRH